MRNPIQNLVDLETLAAVMHQPVGSGWSMVWNKIVPMLFLAWVVVPGWGNTTLAWQQPDRSMREFRALPPEDLFGVLSSFYPDGSPKPDFDATQMERSSELDALEKKGRDFLSSLTPEQRELAWSYAQKYLQRNGVDSEASKALMNRFGIPKDLQQDLSNQFEKLEDSTFENRDEFRDAMRRATQRAMTRARNRGERPQENDALPSKSDESSDRQFSDFDRRMQRNPDSRSTPDAGESETERTTGEIDNDSGMTPSRNSQGTSPEPSRGQPTSDLPDESIRSGSDGDRQPGTENPDRGSGDAIPEGYRMDPNSKSDPNAELDPNSKAESTQDASDPRSLSTPAVKANNEVAPPPNGNADAEPSVESGRNSAGGSNPLANLNGKGDGTDYDWANQLRDLVGDDPTGSQGASGDRDRSGGTSSSTNLNSQDRRGMLDALKKIAAESSSNIDKNLLKGARETLSKSAGSARKSSERLTARFDRLLVDAAKRSLDSKRGLGAELGGSESTESVFDKVIDRVHKSVVKPKTKPKSANPQSEQSTQRRNRRSRPSNSASRTETESPLAKPLRSQSRQNSGSGQGSSDTPAFQGVDLAGSYSKLPKIQPGKVLLWVACIAGVMILGFLLLKRVSTSSEPSKRRRFGKKFRHARIHSPRDLVEAVDYFLINQFGSESRWWNERHAQEMLCEGAPQYSAKISELIRDYVRARYMRAEVKLSEGEQKRYKSTLHELSKLSEPSAVPATGTEG